MIKATYENYVPYLNWKLFQNIIVIFFLLNFVIGSNVNVNDFILVIFMNKINFLIKICGAWH